MGKKCGSCGSGLGFLGLDNQGSSAQPLCYDCSKKVYIEVSKDVNIEEQIQNKGLTSLKTEPIRSTDIVAGVTTPINVEEKKSKKKIVQVVTSVSAVIIVFLTIIIHDYIQNRSLVNAIRACNSRYIYIPGNDSWNSDVSRYSSECIRNCKDKYKGILFFKDYRL
jgi:hypothetical protein